jgi:hypothetical protein
MLVVISPLRAVKSPEPLKGKVILRKLLNSVHLVRLTMVSKNPPRRERKRK